MVAIAVCAALPTKTTALNRGNSASSRRRASSDAPTSTGFAGRIFVSVPIYQGTTFHMTVRRRGIPASRFSSKTFFAVSSGLFREMKPDATARAPGASSRKSNSASVPPSHGSKSGIFALMPRSARNSATNAVSGATCGSPSCLDRDTRAAASASSFGRSIIDASVIGAWPLSEFLTADLRDPPADHADARCTASDRPPLAGPPSESAGNYKARVPSLRARLSTCSTSV